MVLHKQMDFLCQDVETLKNLLKAQTSSTNYTSERQHHGRKKKQELEISSFINC